MSQTNTTNEHSDVQIRMFCVDQANRMAPHNPADLINTSQRIYDFVINNVKTQAKKEII